MTATPLPSPPTPAPGIPPSLGGVGPQEAGTLAVANAALRGGFVLLPRTLLHAPGLSRDAKLLYAVLLSYAWQQGSCFPGAERLQHDLGCGKNQVTRYLQELEDAGLVSRRRRGQGKTTLYTLHDPPAPPPAPPLDGQAARRAAAASPEQGTRSPRTGEARLPKSGNQDAPKRGAEYDSGEEDPEEHHHPPLPAAAPDPPAPMAPTSSPPHEPTGAVDDDALLEILISHGVTQRIARELAATHSGEMIRQQVEWQRYRPTAKSPVGALVQAIRDSWPAPPAWIEAQEHGAAVARQREEDVRRMAEDAARRREWEQKPPQERIAGRLEFWLRGRRHKGHEPTAAEIAAKRAALLAEVATAGGVS